MFPRFERTMDRCCQALVSKLETPDPSLSLIGLHRCHNVAYFNSPTEGRPTNLARSRMSSWSSVFCVADNTVNFYVKKSNQIAASDRFRHDHAGENIPFVWH